MIDVLELLQDGTIRAHTSIVLTYGLDLMLYDGLLRRTFRAAGVASQLVFCDFRQHQAELDGIGNTKKFGIDYSVTPVLQTGAFHPKLYLLLGRSTARMIVGSGNATTGGVLRNAELFGHFEFDENIGPPHSAFRTVVDWVSSLAERASPYVREQVRRAIDWSPWLFGPSHDDGRELLVMGPGRPTLGAHASRLIGDRDVRRILLSSASFDRTLDAMKWFADRAPVDCIVPSQVNIDGAAVKRLGDRVHWHPFVDVVGKGTGGDSKLHAKLFVFDCGEREVVLFGSANASSPAWLRAENSECVVALPERPSGATADALGLGASLEAPTIEARLRETSWSDESDAQPETPALLLIAASAEAARIVLTLERGSPPPGAQLRFVRSRHGPSVHAAPLSLDNGIWFAATQAPEGHARTSLVYIVGPAGEVLSNPVGLTWADVANRAPSTRLSDTIAHALGCVVDGLVAGLTLFELLEQTRDFEVVFTRSGGSEGATAQPETNDGTANGYVPFYTDSVDRSPSHRQPWGDRMDLEILTTLIQPLRTLDRPPQVPSATTSSEPRQTPGTEEDEDDGAIDEEAQRLALDNPVAKKVPLAGSKPTAAAILRAAARLTRRLDRAAGSVHDALAARRRLRTLPPSAIARQLWMLAIAAALTGRELESAEGEDIPCLAPIDFADYVLRIARAFAGGRDGGLLALIDPDAWGSREGALLRDGLAFAWACTLWASATTVQFWRNERNDEYYANGPHDAAPELVAARFTLALRSLCEGPDIKDIRRRLPAWDGPGDGWLEPWCRRVEALADMMIRLDVASPEGDPLIPSKARRGMLVRSPLGVSIVAGRADRWTGVLDLSRPDAEVVARFTRAVFRVDFEGPGGGILWRTTGALSEEPDDW